MARPFGDKHIFLAISLLVGGSAQAADPAPRHAILISIDGLAGFYLDDPRAPIRTLRQLAAEGAVCSQMKCSFPTVTWPNHTSLVTGVSPAVHGVLGNNVMERESGNELKLIGDSKLDKTDLVRALTIYDAAHAAGLTTAAISWPATRNAPTLTWTLPDVYTRELFERYATPGWYSELRESGVPVDFRGKWVDVDETMARCDWLSTQATVQVIERHRPNLILLHLLVCDSVQHKYGPRTPEAYWALSYADDRVCEILDAVARAGLASQTSIVIVSDHGFFAINKVILPNIALKQAGLLRAAGRDVIHKDAYVLSQGGAAAVYIADRTKAADLTPRLIELLGSLEGVAKVLKPDEFSALGQPTPPESPWAANLWLAAKEGYVFWHGVEGDQTVTDQIPAGAPNYRGMHGYLPDHRDMRGSLIISGHGTRAGVRLVEVSNLDVAPTLARLLGVPFPTAQGKVLEDALK